MVYCKSKKVAFEYTARTQLADYLQSIEDIPVTANAWVAALHKCAHECWESQNRQQADCLQVLRSSAWVYLCADLRLGLQRWTIKFDNVCNGSHSIFWIFFDPLIVFRIAKYIQNQTLRVFPWFIRVANFLGPEIWCLIPDMGSKAGVPSVSCSSLTLLWSTHPSLTLPWSKCVLHCHYDYFQCFVPLFPSLHINKDSRTWILSVENCP